MRRLAAALFALAVASAPALAQPYPDRAPPYEPGIQLDVDLDAAIYTDVDIAPVGDEIPDVAVFYDRLAPYGTWLDDPVYGYVFAPADPGYVPYTTGHWKLTDFGWTWIAAEPHGWATSHYGRWVWRDRWVWRPDTTWGPAWVQWRESERVVGWAPLGYDVDAYVPETHWRFIPTAYITSTELPRYYVRTDVPRYIRDTRPIVRWTRHADRRWVAGPDRAYLERHQVRVQRATYQPREVGRLSAVERRQAEQRAAEAKVKYRARVSRDAQVRTQLETKRAQVERTQVERQRVRQQTRNERTEQANRAQQRDAQQRQQVEDKKTAQQRQRQQVEERKLDQQETQQRRQQVEERKPDRREAQQRRQQVEERKLQDKQHEQNARRQLEEQKQQREQRQREQADQRRDQARQRRGEQDQRRDQKQAEQRRERAEPRRAEPKGKPPAKQDERGKP